MVNFQKNNVIIGFRRRRIAADELGYFELARISTQVLAFYGAEIQINLEKVIKFEPSMVAPLVILLRQSQIQGNEIKWRGMQPGVREVFALHNLVGSVNYTLVERYSLPTRRLVQYSQRPRRIIRRDFRGLDRSFWPNWTFFGLREFSTSQTLEFALFAKRSLENNRVPRMSEALRGKFFEAIDELFVNSSLHARSTVNNTVSGFFDKSTGVLHFVLADGGRGIQGAYNATYKGAISAEAAIDWALTPGSTTRQGDIPGGLGLKILRKFIQTNRGGLTVISHNGFWRERDGHLLKLSMPYLFPGTVVSIEINTADDNSYDLDEADAEDIW